MIEKLLFPGKNMESPESQGADFVELFFDLVFVYAITRVTALTAHHLDPLHVLRSVLVFWLIWWGWTQFTWALNSANTKIAPVRMVVLIATAVAFVMASSIDLSFSPDVMWFALPYVIIRAIGLTLYIRVINNLKEQHSAVVGFTLPSILGLLAVIGGALDDPSSRAWWWLGAIALDMIAGYIGGRGEGWKIQAGHFAERHGLIVIIALGESLIVAASALSKLERSHDLLMIGGLAVLVTCLLWWSYFAWINERAEENLAQKTKSEQARMARDAYSFIHFLLICGIIGIAVGFEKVMYHPHDLLTLPVAASLFGGYALFIGSTGATIWRTSGIILIPRFFFMLVTLLAMIFAVGRTPQFALGIIAVSSLMVIMLEWRKCRFQ